MKVIILAILSAIALAILIAATPLIVIYRIFHCAVYKKTSIGWYFKNMLNATTQFGGALIYGTEDWTTSAMTHFKAKYMKSKSAIAFEKIIDFLSLGFETEHCKKTYHREREELKKEAGVL